MDFKNKGKLNYKPTFIATGSYKIFGGFLYRRCKPMNTTFAFDEIPENKQDAYLCEICDGDIVKNREGIWECNCCDWTEIIGKKQ